MSCCPIHWGKVNSEHLVHMETKKQREIHAMTHGELTHVLMLCIHHFEENSQVDPIHSYIRSHICSFHQDVTVLWLDQLSQDFKAPWSFPYINSKARPFDFTLEHYQNSTGVGLCRPLGAFPLLGRGPSTLPDRGSPTTRHCRMTAGLLSQHMPARRKAQKQQPRIHGTSHSSS